MGRRVGQSTTTASTAQISGRSAVMRSQVDALVAAVPELAGLRPERDADRVERVAGHRLAQHATGRRPSWGRPSPWRSQRVAAVGRLPHGGRRVGHEAAPVVAVERDDPERLRVARMGRPAGSRTGWAGRCAVTSVQVSPPSVRAVHPAVVLLVERLGLAGRGRELVDALPGDRVRVRVEVGADAAVARLPGRAAVLRLEDADRRDADPRPLRVGRVGDDRVQDEAAGAGLPGRSRSRGSSGPRRATRSRRGRRCGTGRPARRRRACRRRGSWPGSRPWRSGWACRRRRGRPRRVGQALARVGPGLAEVLAAPDGRAVPRRAAAGQDRAAAGLDDEVVDRPALAQRAAHRPVAALGVALEDERALGRADEEEHSGHRPDLRDRLAVARPGSAARLERIDDPAVGLDRVDIGTRRRRPTVPACSGAPR